MQTILSGHSNEVIIDSDGPVIIIGESINPTRRKKMVSSLQEGDLDYIVELADKQIKTGADVLDINVGYPGVDDVKMLPKVVKIIQDNFDIPLSLDSQNPAAIEAALKVSAGKCLINSVNGEETLMKVLLPLANEYGAAIIGLCMDEQGITHDPEKRVKVAEKIIARAVDIGIKPENIIIDPLAMAVSADPRACLVTLETIRLIHLQLGHNITLGASNISFGLPDRETLNNTFLTLSVYNGVTCPIANPEKITPAIRATDLIMDRDNYAMRFVEYYQRIQKLQ
jgi:5-methyltetrahydrofolate--homocysteine methyltransferase